MKDTNSAKGKNKITKEVINSLSEKSEWKKHFTLNPEATIYGNNEAAIYDYGMFDQYNQPLPIIDNSEYMHIKIKVQFNQDVEESICIYHNKGFSRKGRAETIQTSWE
ncbi:MAG: hypothetical protein V8R51_06265 [Clostridia bacterium]